MGELSKGKRQSKRQKVITTKYHNKGHPKGKHYLRSPKKDHTQISPRRGNTKARYIMYTGQPGSGKTTKLLKLAKRALAKREEVHIVSTRESSRAVSMKIRSDLSRQKTSAVHLHDCHLYNPGEVERLCKELGKAARKAKITVIIDNAHDGPQMEVLCKHLKALENVSILAAARNPSKLPSSLEEKHLEGSFRLPAPVQTVMDRATTLNTDPPVTRKPKVKAFFGESHITRLSHQRCRRLAKEPKDCTRCGENVAVLLAKCGVGAPSDKTKNYKYQQVIALVRGDTELFDLTTVSARGKSNGSLGFVEGLRKRDIPVRVVGRDDDEGLLQLATLTGPNEVVVTNEHLVQGLERPVVVWLGVGTGDYYDVVDKWNATACTTDQVLWVQDPGEVDLDSDDKDEDDE